MLFWSAQENRTMKTVLAILCIISHHGIRDGMQRERPVQKEVERSDVIGGHRGAHFTLSSTCERYAWELMGGCNLAHNVTLSLALSLSLYRCLVLGFAQLFLS